MPSRQGPRLRLQLSSFSHPKSGLPALVDSHPLCSSLQLIHPTSKGGSVLVNELQPTGYITSNIRISDLVADLTSLSASCSSEFHGNESTAGKTKVTALALGPCMDRDGGAAISDGVLHLTVGRALYETLGLTGRNNPADTGSVYHVAVDLTSKGMRPGKPLHERVTERLKTLPAGRLALAGSRSVATASNTTSQKGLGTSPDEARLTSAGTQEKQPADQEMPDAGRQKPGQPQLDLLTLLPCLKAPGANCKHHSLQASSWTVTGVAVPRLRRADVTNVAAARQQQEQRSQALPEFISLQGNAPLPGSRASHKQKLASKSQPSSQQVQSMEVDGDTPGQPPANVSQDEVRLQHGMLQGLVDYLGAVSCGMTGAMCTELLPEPFKAEAKPGAQVPLPGDILGGGGSDLGDSLEVKRWQGLIVTDTVHHVLAAARTAVTAGDLPWAAVSVWGWEHSPVGWSGLAKQGGGVGVAGSMSCVGQGANTHYTVIVLEGGQDYLVVQGLGTGDMPFS